jgi:hypothetical protein
MGLFARKRKKPSPRHAIKGALFLASALSRKPTKTTNKRPEEPIPTSVAINIIAALFGVFFGIKSLEYFAEWQLPIFSVLHSPTPTMIIFSGVFLLIADLLQHKFRLEKKLKLDNHTSMLPQNIGDQMLRKEKLIRRELKERNVNNIIATLGGVVGVAWSAKEIDEWWFIFYLPAILVCGLVFAAIFFYASMVVQNYRRKIKILREGADVDGKPPIPEDKGFKFLNSVVIIILLAFCGAVFGSIFSDKIVIFVLTVAVALILILICATAFDAHIKYLAKNYDSDLGES